MGDPHPIFTIGHSTRSLDDFVAALKAAGVDFVADVRRFPSSRRYPHFNGTALAQSLAAVSITYRHFEALGGRREGQKGGGPSHNTLWRQEMFRNYADYAETDAFRAALEELRALSHARSVAVMCAEAVWWRCHRRIIADYLIAAGERVVHILDKGKLEPARLTEGAAPQPDGTIVYAGNAPALPF
jgi:uncharacterized protein (DUF488 family)